MSHKATSHPIHTELDLTRACYFLVGQSVPEFTYAKTKRRLKKKPVTARLTFKFNFGTAKALILLILHKYMPDSKAHKIAKNSNIYKPQPKDACSSSVFPAISLFFLSPYHHFW